MSPGEAPESSPLPLSGFPLCYPVGSCSLPLPKSDPSLAFLQLAEDLSSSHLQE